jgi:hypothetical protein
MFECVPDCGLALRYSLCVPCKRIVRGRILGRLLADGGISDMMLYAVMPCNTGLWGPEQ